MIMDDINKRMKENNYILSTEQLTDIGISKTTLTNYVRDGLLERCGHGFYTVPDSVEDDMYLLMLRSKHIIFSHETALFLNGLSERTPFIHAVTIPSTAAIPSTIKEQCKCYYVKPELHKMGLIEKSRKGRQFIYQLTNQSLSNGWCIGNQLVHSCKSMGIMDGADWLIDCASQHIIRPYCDKTSN